MNLQEPLRILRALCAGGAHRVDYITITYVEKLGSSDNEVGEELNDYMTSSEEDNPTYS